MPDMIRDGKGNGYLAQVDNENRLVTSSIIRTHIHHHSLSHGDAYNVYFRHTQVAAATNEIVGYIQYTGTNFLVIHQTVFSTNSAGETKFEVFGNPTGLSGGVDITPTALRFGSAKTLLVTAKDTNKGVSAITSATEGSEFSDIRIGWNAQATFTYEYHDSIILGKDAIFMILANSASLGDVIRVNTTYYEEELR